MTYSSHYRLMVRVLEIYERFSIKNAIKLLLGYKSFDRIIQNETILKRCPHKVEKKDSIITGDAFNNNYNKDSYDAMSDVTSFDKDTDTDFSAHINKEFSLRPRTLSYNSIVKNWLYSLGTNEMHFVNEIAHGWNFWIPRAQTRWFAYKRRRYFYRKLPNKAKWYSTLWKLPDKPYGTVLYVPHPRRSFENLIIPSDFVLSMVEFHLKLSMFLLSRELELFIELVDKQKIPDYVTPLDLRFFSWSFKGLKMRLVNRIRLLCYYLPKRFQDFFLQYSINLRKIAIFIFGLLPRLIYRIYRNHYIEPKLIESEKRKRESIALYNIFEKKFFKKHKKKKKKPTNKKGNKSKTTRDV